MVCGGRKGGLVGELIRWIGTIGKLLIILATRIFDLDVVFYLMIFIIQGHWDRR